MIIQTDQTLLAHFEDLEYIVLAHIYVAMHNSV
jgi:hypothetical protein